MNRRKSYLKASLVERDNYFDADTGDIVKVDQKIHTYIANSKEEFLLVYTSLLSIFKDLTYGAIQVYAYLLLHYRPGTPIEIGRKTRKEIANHSSISESNVANSLTELKKCKLVFSPEQKIYYLNPRYAFRGNTSSRNRELKAIIELGCKNC
ncbi:replication/maintenance protein RepL [Spirosoma litoris]